MKRCIYLAEIPGNKYCQMIFSHSLFRSKHLTTTMYLCAVCPEEEDDMKAHDVKDLISI